MHLATVAVDQMQEEADKKDQVNLPKMSPLLSSLTPHLPPRPQFQKLCDIAFTDQIAHREYDNRSLLKVDHLPLKHTHPPTPLIHRPFIYFLPLFFLTVAAGKVLRPSLGVVV